MRTRDPEAKRRLLLEAASAEFSQHGIAGARVDRIATAAGVSAGLVYTYFGSKDALFDAVFDVIVARTVNDIPITTDDLPGYAARLFDGYEANPEVQRIAAWHRLERGAGEPIAAITASLDDKLAAITAAQKAGSLPTTFTALDLLTIVLDLSGIWATASPELQRMARTRSVAERRATVVAAVAAVLAADPRPAF